MAGTSPESQQGRGRQVWSRAEDSRGRRAALRPRPLGILEVLVSKVGEDFVWTADLGGLGHHLPRVEWIWGT